MELPRTPGSETRLRDAIAPLRDDYAFILLDCPPSLGPLTVNALAAADRVIVPVQAEYYALEGLSQLLRSVELIRRRLNPHLGIGGILLTAFLRHEKALPLLPLSEPMPPPEETHG